MMSVPIATCTVAGMPARAAAARMLVRRCGSRARLDGVADGAPEAQASGDALGGGAVQELAGLARHAEEAAVEPGSDILRRPAAPRELEVVHEAGAVHGDGGDAPALDQIDDQRPEPHLDAVRAHAEDDGLARPRGARDAGGRVAQIASREDVGQPVEQRAHAEPAAYRLAQRGRRHLAGSPPERHRMDAARVDRRWGGPAALHAGTACAVAPYGGLPAA